MVVLHAVGPEPGGGALRATLRVTQTPIVHPLASTRAKLRDMTIAAQSARSRLDNFAHAERSSPAANAREASRTILRSWHTRRLPQRHAPREQSSATHGQLRLRCASAPSAPMTKRCLNACNGVISHPDARRFARCGENEETSSETCLLWHEIGDLVSRQVHLTRGVPRNCPQSTTDIVNWVY